MKVVGGYLVQTHLFISDETAPKITVKMPVKAMSTVFLKHNNVDNTLQLETKREDACSSAGEGKEE